MSSGSFVRNYPLQIWSASYNGGSPGWWPCGSYLSKTWSGGDSSRPYVTQTLRIPALTQIVERRRKDGSSYYKEVLVKPARVVKKRFFTTAFRQPNAYQNDIRNRYLQLGRGYYGVHPYVQNGTWQLWGQPYIPGFPSNASAWSTNDDIRLVSKLAEQINDSDFDPAVFLGTLNQTLDLIADRTKKIAKSIAYLRKGNFVKSFEAVTGHRRLQTRGKTAGQLMLEIQYGWRPLISDVHEGATWLAAKLQKPMVHRVSKRLRREIPLAIDNGSATGRLFSSGSLKVSKQLVAYLSEGKADTSLNLYSPANLAWELLPWSFVVDWFIPIGEYLSSRGAASELKGTFVTTVLRDVGCDGWKPSPNGNVYSIYKAFQDLSGGSPKYREFAMQRTVSTTLDVPLPTFKGLGKAASWEHCANAVALLASSRSDKPDDVLRNLGRLVPKRVKLFNSDYAHL